jgi:hypothetical protein
LPEYQISFTHPGSYDEPLAVGEAIRWVGPVVWRVEAVEGDRVAVRLWPNDEPYPSRIRPHGPGEWPQDTTAATAT